MRGQKRKKGRKRKHIGGQGENGRERERERERENWPGLARPRVRDTSQRNNHFGVCLTWTFVERKRKKKENKRDR